MPGDQYGDAEVIDLKYQPKDLDVAVKFPELLIVTTENGILLRGSQLIPINNLGFTPTAAGISPDGREAVIGSQYGKLYIFSIKGDTLVKESLLEKHRGAITTIRFSPDGSMFASGDTNREAVVWDTISHEVGFQSLFEMHYYSCLLKRCSILFESLVLRNDMHVAAKLELSKYSKVLKN